MTAKKASKGKGGKSYSFHDIVDAFPAIDPEELKALDKDIAEHGVKVPVLVWNGMIVDGRHRVTLADKHKKRLKFETFKGSELEMIDEVFRRNFLRRHLTSSQRAAAVVDFERRRSEVRVAAGRPKNDDTTPTTQDMADMSGTNRTYISQARAVADSDPKLLGKVMSGDVTLPEAVEQVTGDRPGSKSKKKKKKSSKSKSDDDADDSEEDEEEDRVWKDALGHEIPEAVRELFDEDDLFDDLIQKTKEIVEIANRIADKTCGSMFDKSIVLVEARNIRNEAEQRRPYTICPACMGKKGGCQKCRRNGVLNKQQFGLFPEGERRKHGEKK